MRVNVEGRELDIEFTYASQGYRIWVTEWDGQDWQEIPSHYGIMCILMTQFDALCSLSSELFDEAVHGETMAEQLNVEMRFYDDDEYDCECCEDLETVK